MCNVPWNPTDLCNPVPGVEVVEVAEKQGIRRGQKGRGEWWWWIHGQGR